MTKEEKAEMKRLNRARKRINDIISNVGGGNVRYAHITTDERGHRHVDGKRVNKYNVVSLRVCSGDKIELIRLPGETIVDDKLAINYDEQRHYALIQKKQKLEDMKSELASTRAQ